MKRLLTFVAIILLFGWVLFKASVWWLADQRLADTRAAMEQVGVIERGSISSGIEGRLLLNDASYQDFRLAGPLRAGRVTFDAGSPVNLLKTLLDPAALPPSWTLRGERLGVRVEASMFRNWVTDGADGADTLFAPVCGPDHRQQLGSGDLVRMGMNGIGGEVLIRQQPEDLYLEITTDKAGSLEARWPGARLDVLNPDSPIQGADGPMRVILRDGGLMRRIAAYCARESAVATEEWTEIVMEAFRSGLNARGYEASPQLLALYRQWLTEGGELTLTLMPGEELMGVPVREPDGEQSATLAVRYNEQVVPDVFLRAVQPPESTVAGEAVQPLVPEGEDGQVAGWYPADVTEAGRWKGRTVKATLSNGNVVEGRLASVDEQTLEIARIVGGGEVAYPIVIRAIESFEVWRRGQTR
ncbi:acetylornithine deacetylase [Marinobacter goseongensis]|uniref:acetylornithine deacetylase n=1 Tax=Marinobacter goseongensis TaxID=453838 RepID=UPI00200658FF|nr:acetylornithine deacetylase [Marinobacter goseongensis]MCK7550453.1 acetylornithine deacetylase [Marinobacter goseongensis]